MEHSNVTPDGAGGLRSVKTKKQVSYCFAHAQRKPAPPTVLRAIMDHVAALTKRFEVSQPVVGGIMIKVRRRQRHFCPENRNGVDTQSKARQGASPSITPGQSVLVPPSPVT